ncbi:hypothetical protein DdX_09866 [Ditylenchus destructor]|uniref:Uncharacterized protein n=1 Tax=Ditylenchus destructor TaxID=166010 RepID=A0AAD4N3N5_9BILA|nr:hypothetical protein DdX_09866 [Ditylenchus destructor]
MLGMMNCPTDNVEFYSASPSSKRALLAGSTTPTSTSSDDATNSQNTTHEDTVRVFSEAKDKPQVTYTEDGRKMVDGKILEGDYPKADPMQMWEKLILSKIATGQLKDDLQQQAVPFKHRRKCSDESSDRPTPSIPEHINSQKIQPTTPIQVNSVRLMDCSSKSMSLPLKFSTTDIV